MDERRSPTRTLAATDGQVPNADRLPGDAGTSIWSSRGGRASGAVPGSKKATPPGSTRGRLRVTSWAFGGRPAGTTRDRAAEDEDGAVTGVREE